MLETMTAIDTIKTIPIIIFILSGMLSSAILERILWGRKRIKPVVTAILINRGDGFLKLEKSLSNVVSILISTPMLYTSFLSLYRIFWLLHSLFTQNIPSSVPFSSVPVFPSSAAHSFRHGCAVPPPSKREAFTLPLRYRLPPRGSWQSR